MSANPSTSVYGQAVTLTAGLDVYAAQGHSTNGESVTFYNGSTSLGTGVLSSGIATLRVTSLPVGTDKITAVYAGDSTFQGSTAAPYPVTITSASTFTIAATPPSETVTRGRLAAFILQLKSVNGFNGNVTLSCSGGPTGSYCADLPQTVRVNGTAYAISGILFPAKSTPGTYKITFTGTSGSLISAATATFIVK